MEKTVAVAMSGGLDSSYALIKLKEEGYPVIGVTLKLFCYGENQASPSSCCSIDSIRHARNICKSLGVKHYIIDAEEVFRKEVINYFVNAYKEGFTPNPCVVCNREVKWAYLSRKAEELGAHYLATGHYSQILYSEKIKRYILKCGIDKDKDQSYYLWPLTQENLKRTLFPLGNMRKKEIKKEMEKYDIKLAKKPESQEICFIPDNDYRRFLTEEENLIIEPGNILDPSGKILGVHKGYPFYTVGQRRGLGVSSEKRLYVKSIDHIKNEVILDSFDELYKKELIFSKANFISYNMPDENMIFKARIRYRGKLEECKLKKLDNEKYHLNFSSPVWGVTRGQSVVIYEDDTVVGGGIIL